MDLGEAMTHATPQRAAVTYEEMKVVLDRIETAPYRDDGLRAYLQCRRLAEHDRAILDAVDVGWGDA